jgi:hypothetical protein
MRTQTFRRNIIPSQIKFPSLEENCSLHLKRAAFLSAVTISSDGVPYSSSSQSVSAIAWLAKCPHNLISSSSYSESATVYKTSRGSTVGIAPGYGPGRPSGRSWNPGKVKNCLFPISSRPAPGPTQPPIQWVKGTLSPGVQRMGRETDYHQLVPRSRRRGSIHPFPRMSSWSSA